MRNYNSYYNCNRGFQQPQGIQNYNQQGSYSNAVPSSYGQVGYNSSYNYYGSGDYSPYSYGYSYSQPQGIQNYNQQGSYSNAVPSSYGQVGYNSSYNYYGSGDYSPYSYGYSYSQPQGIQNYNQQGSYSNAVPSSYSQGTRNLGRYSSSFSNRNNIGNFQNQASKGFYEPLLQGNKFWGWGSNKY